MIIRRLSFLLVTVLAFCAVETVAVSAQSATASLSGVTIDQHDALLPGVSITVSNEDTGFQRTVNTNRDSFFVLTLLPPRLSTCLWAGRFLPSTASDAPT